MIQNEVILGVPVLLWSTRYEHVIVPEELLQACDLEEQQRMVLRDILSQEETNAVPFSWTDEVIARPRSDFHFYYTEPPS